MSNNIMCKIQNWTRPGEMTQKSSSKSHFTRNCKSPCQSKNIFSQGRNQHPARLQQKRPYNLNPLTFNHEPCFSGHGVCVGWYDATICTSIVTIDTIDDKFVLFPDHLVTIGTNYDTVVQQPRNVRLRWMVDYLCEDKGYVYLKDLKFTH